MKCMMFYEANLYETQVAYNKWAKDKQLHKDVIIHSHLESSQDGINPCVAILVFFDEVQHPTW